MDSKNHVLWSNRSAARAGKKEWEAALSDAEEVTPSAYLDRNSLSNLYIQCVKVNPSWAKGYARKGAALHGARRYDDAILAYEAGIKLEDSPALRRGLQEVRDAKGMLEMMLVVLKCF